MAQLDSYIRTDLKPRHLHLLVALDNIRNLGRVAEYMHVTQPAVSKSLAELERGVGLRLFERTARGVHPTIYGECLIRHARSMLTDLAQARFASVDPERRTAVLALAQPRVSSPRLDHRRTKLFALSSSGLWLITPGEGPYAEAVNRTYAEAQASVEASAASGEAMARARAQAEAVLGCFFRALGWNVTVRWDGR